MILFLLSTFAFFGCLILTALSVVGALRSYKAFKHANASAIYNASLWAQSEHQRHEAEIENARLRGSFDTSQTNYIQMSRIAREAIKAGEVAVDVPEKLRTIDDDSVLNDTTLENL